MGRPVMLGNGSLTVGLNEQGLVHDFYYPYVGLDNLTTARSVHHKIGIWVDGAFSWVDDGSWQIDVSFEPDSLVSEISMTSEKLEVRITAKDFVDYDWDVFCRQLVVENMKDEQKRQVRLFMHQVFQISRAGRADTALFEPNGNYILDYKGRCSLLIYGQTQAGGVFNNYAVGNYGIEGKEGTFRDAEDGQLSGSAVEHGGVDSVIQFDAELAGQEKKTFDYWIVVSDSQFSCEEIHDNLQHEGLSVRMDKTRAYWQKWLATGAEKLATIHEDYREITQRSLLLIKAHTDKRGGVIASCDSSIYNYGRDYYSYVWPRDGAYALWPLIRLGYYEEAKKFFEFCQDIMTPGGYLMHKYQPDRAIGSTWHPLLHKGRKELAIQEDETAIVIFMLGEFLHYAKDEDFVRSMYDSLVRPAADFMAEFTDADTNLPHASYDLWEEKFLTNTYTVATVYQSLVVAAELAEVFDATDDAVKWRQSADSMKEAAKFFVDPVTSVLRKGFLLQPDGSLTFDSTLDISSLYGAAMFDLFDSRSDQVMATMTAIEDVLLDKTPSGGCPRYAYDHYFETNAEYLGNPWFVSTLWMAQLYIRKHRSADAKEYIDWALAHAAPGGALSEQIHPENGQPLSVLPLVWSHAELVNTILDFSQNKNGQHPPTAQETQG